MTPRQRQSAIDGIKDRIDVLLRLREHGGYPFERYLSELPEICVDVVLAHTKEPRKPFPWPASFPRPDFPHDEQTT